MEFKIGDWQVDVETALDEFEPWQPKEGEWCWFWDEYICRLRLAQFLFLNPADDSFKRDMYHFDFPKGTHKIMGVNGASYYCEPFIGQLPTFLKDK